VVVSTDAYNRSRPDLLVAAVSTQVSRASAFDHVLHDWRAAGLRYPSVVKGRVVALAQSLVRRAIGRLSSADQAAYDERLLTILGTDASIREAFL
jgi:mRNA-degrading endonuclease toxin of MazEF toxin-antitoxin module